MLPLTLCALFALAPSEAHHGSGGPYVAVTGSVTHETLAVSTGGAGYSYHWGSIRLGAGGEGSVYHTTDGDDGRLGWGGLWTGLSLWENDWLELPLLLHIGGGGWSVERVVASRAGREVIERRHHRLFVAVLTTGLEVSVLRTVKLCLHAGYFTGWGARARLHGPRGALQVSFLIPRPGH